MRSLLLAVFVVLATTAVARAERRAAEGQVVHTRRAPVVLHRAVPPYRGVHVYQGRR